MGKKEGILKKKKKNKNSEKWFGSVLFCFVLFFGPIFGEVGNVRVVCFQFPLFHSSNFI